MWKEVAVDLQGVLEGLKRLRNGLRKDGRRVEKLSKREHEESFQTAL
jgi:hypothetical protein